MSGGTAGGGSISGGVLLVYLDADLGKSVTDLVETGSFYYQHKRGYFDTVLPGPEQGYILPVDGLLPDNADHLSAAHFASGTATLVIVHDKVPVYVRLQYINNENGEFEDPPDFD